MPVSIGSARSVTYRFACGILRKSRKEQWFVSREEILKLTALSSCAG